MRARHAALALAAAAILVPEWEARAQPTGTSIPRVALGPETDGRAPADDGFGEWPFHVGERLEYDLYLRGHRAGRCVLEVEAAEIVRGVPSYRVSLSLEAGALFFRIDQRKVSWIAPGPFRSLRFVEADGDGPRRVVELDHAAGSWTEGGPGSSDDGGPGPGTSAEMARAAVDEVGFIYLLRLLELEPGRTYTMDRHYEARRNPITVAVEGRGEARTPGGEFRALVLHPVLPESDVFSEAAGAELLLSDDARRIVVQVRSQTRLGPMTLRLREYDPGP